MHGGLVANLGGPNVRVGRNGQSKTAPAQLSTEAALEVLAELDSSLGRKRPFINRSSRVNLCRTRVDRPGELRCPDLTNAIKHYFAGGDRGNAGGKAHICDRRGV